MPVSARKQEENRKRIALSFFRLIAQEGPIAALRIFHPKAKHHNPYCAPGMKALLTDPLFQLKRVLVDGDMVAVHTTLQSKSDKTQGFRQVHLFRFRKEKVIEYWDVTQMVPKKAKYPKNMF
jgi:predicted SnoaL-like aldol condensation-catalyzing enzyme